MAKKSANLKYYEAVGRRKSSVARVRLYIAGKDKEVTVGTMKLKAGDMVVNKKPIADYFPALTDKVYYLQPLRLANSEGRFVVSIQVGGGGKNGQLEACIHGLARALEMTDKDHRPALKKHGLLRRDARIKERRKVGTGGKARRQKQSPKR